MAAPHMLMCRIKNTILDGSSDEITNRVTFDMKTHGNRLTCLTTTHEGLDRDHKMHAGVSDGWPKILTNLKSLLEFGRVLPHSSLGTQKTAPI